MKATTIIKIALVILAVTALVYWREIWIWVDAKTWHELTTDILGFVLKWFFLALFGFLAASLPHYLKPWMRLWHKTGYARLRNARRGGGVSIRAARYSTPKVNKDAMLIALLEREMRQNGGRRE